MIGWDDEIITVCIDEQLGGECSLASCAYWVSGLFCLSLTCRLAFRMCMQTSTHATRRVGSYSAHSSVSSPSLINGSFILRIA